MLRTEVLVGIPTYNGAQRVDWLLQSIFNNTDNKLINDLFCKIVICDDSGSPSHQEKTLEVGKKHGVHVLVNKSNIGLPKTWNKLVSCWDSKNVILINDDIIVAPDWLETMVYFLNNNPHAGSVSHFCHFIALEDIQPLLKGETIKPRDPFTKAHIEFHDHFEQPGRVMAPAGCFFGFSREKFNLVGGFDENYKVFYEESDFGTSLASHGFPSYVLCYPRNYHIWSATFSSAPEIRASELMAQSRAYYIQKWNGHFEDTHPRYMSKIPFRKIRWLYKGKECEALITSDFGFHEV